MIVAIGPCISKKTMRLKTNLKKNLLKKIEKILFFLVIKKIKFILI